MKSILVTGANGFLGSHLLEEMIKQRYKIVILCRESSDMSRIVKFLNHVKIVHLENLEQLEPLFIEEEISGIIHLATDYGRDKNLHDVMNANVMMPLKLVEYAIKYKSIFFINTDTFIAKQNSDYNYLNSYAKSKYIFKDLLQGFSDKINVINMKIEHLYGTNDSKDKFVTYILNSLIENIDNIDLTSGEQKRDFIYVKDVVNGYLLILQNIRLLLGYNEYEVGSGISTSIKEFVEKAKKLTKSSTILNFGKLPTRKGEFKESRANNQNLLSLGWDIKYDVDTGLREIIALEKK